MRCHRFDGRLLRRCQGPCERHRDRGAVAALVTDGHAGAGCFDLVDDGLQATSGEEQAFARVLVAGDNARRLVCGQPRALALEDPGSRRLRFAAGGRGDPPSPEGPPPPGISSPPRAGVNYVGRRGRS